MNRAHWALPLAGTLSLLLAASTTACRDGKGDAPSPVAVGTPQQAQAGDQGTTGRDTTSSTMSSPPQAAAGDTGGEISKASLAVMDFTFHTSSGVEGHREFSSALLTDRIVTALAQTRKFRLVERQQVSGLLKEFKLTEQGFTSKAQAVRAGDMVGADYLVLGSISHMSAVRRTEAVPYTSETTTILSGRISGTMRVVDSRTGEIAASWPEEASRTQRSDDGSANLESVYESMQVELAESVARAIVDAVYPIKVASIGADGTLFLNAGRGRGLEVGDTVELFQPGAAIIDPDTREQLGVEESKVGRARVSDVRDRLALAKVLDSTAPLAPGTVARKSAKNARSGAPSPAPAVERPKLNW